MSSKPQHFVNAAIAQQVPTSTVNVRPCTKATAPVATPAPSHTVKPPQLKTGSSESNPPVAKRFTPVSEEELKKFETINRSQATNKNTKWGVKILQDWHWENYNTYIDFEAIGTEELAAKLALFYCEAKPKEITKRAETMPKIQAEEYHQHTLQNIRAAINRHMQDIGRDIDIVNNQEFYRTNKLFDGMMKDRKQNDVYRSKPRSAIIETEDLKKISDYFVDAESSPVKLRQSVWYNIGIHFVTLAREFHEQLRVDSFLFDIDEDGVEYAYICPSAIDGSQNDLHSKRMYATGKIGCPVNQLKLLLKKTDKNATSLFNSYTKKALEDHESPIWYTAHPLHKRTFLHLMPDISSCAGCSRRYTAHSLKATCSAMQITRRVVDIRKILCRSGNQE